ncbi:MAG: phosphotransferase [Bacteroidota bacterium]|nr:phosphotransferase [Bacteroidota bacterium]
MAQFPVEYSSLSAAALLQLAVREYALSTASSISFLKRGFNDTYLISSAGKKHILRVYKHGWRTLESIRSETALLDQLKNNGISVSYAVSDGRGNYIQTIDAPEGKRYAVLFTFAPGHQVRKLTTEESFLLGAETAKMHLLTKDKEMPVAHQYDPSFQIDKTIAVLSGILQDFPEEMTFLKELQIDFSKTFYSVDKNELAQGICHGDLQAENFHVDANNRFTFFDFDFFGSGCLAYDIGVFIWYDHKNKPKEIINAFLKGYNSYRQLTPTEIKLLPYFSTLRALFQMTLYCMISDGKQLPLWPADRVAEFIRKVEKWHSSNKDQ